MKQTAVPELRTSPWKQLQRNVWILMGLLFFLPLSVQAAEEGLNIYVTPVLPESQVDEAKSYFDLNLAPDQKETLALELVNATAESVTIQVSPHTAYTNVLGTVEYGKDASEPDPTLTYSLDEWIETPETIELAGNGRATIELTLQMPPEAFEGFLAGGIRISEVTEETEEESEGEGVAIKNEFAYVVGVVVSNDRSGVQAELDLLDVFADQLNYRNVISATLQNFTPTFVNRLAVEATIQRAGENDVLYEASKEMMQMAPNSHFDFPISLEGERFQSGDYVLTMKASSGDNEWEWTREFTIEADEARALNRADVTIDTNINWWMIGAISLLLLIIVAILYLIFKKRKIKKVGNDE
ncbi:DUF916 and DUF3324 domain-containing protein [Enterococcus casseliflavus]|uniref:DUF916 and DUF3324 domain-containing protein n=1 Tax=Enterococcus sp. 8E11_MSG4843 TaxID=1834190 RepID=UPI000B3E9453|nr:DUF916 and DUF3324 domain-containing protein [Enterococcus sp. 8E11_MSG4843]MBO1097897.1 DUF916 and DUF3324 domain-containing protein [Enterococcus casseliflavus]MBO1145445.1 DUF916 and DUF3324 domain-containing protein [Enterococcus casseliflavus]OUZ30163.1 hypothetical protein A5885_003344 [Enterococcus sp. 8E11_MSG4843]